LKDQKLNGDINTALLQQVKKGEWSWIDFFNKYKDDDYNKESKIEEEKMKENAKKKKDEEEKKKKEDKKRIKHK